MINDLYLVELGKLEYVKVTKLVVLMQVYDSANFTPKPYFLLVF